MLAGRRGPLPLARSFAGTAGVYWLEVFPRVNRELARWRERALSIPDPRLRELALETQRAERGNLEGAAAFAVLVPRRRRASVVRAAVCFQALYDYLDTLAEQPSADPVGHARSLHAALPAALDPRRTASSAVTADGGYLAALVAATRVAATSLPSWSAVAGEAVAAAEEMAAYQSLVHGDTERSRTELELWSRGLTPPGCALSWWETAAGAASSLGVFALLAAAASPDLRASEAAALRAAYFPWIGALHVLLDSLVDREADLRSGDWSLVGHYECSEQMADRLAAIAARAAEEAGQAAHGERHALILGAMASFYLSRPAAREPAACGACEGVLAAVGPAAAPAMAVLRARNKIGDYARRAREAVPAARRGTARAPAAARGHSNSSCGAVTRNSSI